MVLLFTWGGGSSTGFSGISSESMELAVSGVDVVSVLVLLGFDSEEED